MLRLLHRAEDGPSDDVARREFGARVGREHEPLAVHVAKIRALAANGFADEVARRTGDVEHRRVELHELHVAEFGAGPRRRGHAVAGRDRRVRRLAVDHPATAGGENDLLRPDEELAHARSARRPPRRTRRRA